MCVSTYPSPPAPPSKKQKERKEKKSLAGGGAFLGLILIVLFTLHAP